MHWLVVTMFIMECLVESVYSIEQHKLLNYIYLMLMSMTTTVSNFTIISLCNVFNVFSGSFYTLLNPGKTSIILGACILLTFISFVFYLN